MKKSSIKKILFLITIAYIGLWVFLSYKIDQLQKDTEIKMAFLQWAHSNHLKKADFDLRGRKDRSIKKILMGSLQDNQISPSDYAIKENGPNSIILSFKSLSFEKLSQFIDNKNYALIINKLSLERASRPGMVQGEIEILR